MMGLESIPWWKLDSLKPCYLNGVHLVALLRVGVRWGPELEEGVQPAGSAW